MKEVYKEKFKRYKKKRKVATIKNHAETANSDETIQMNLEGVGKFLGSARKEMNLSKYTLTVTTGMNSESISLLEKAEINITLTTFIKFCNSLGISIQLKDSKNNKLDVNNPAELKNL